MLGFLVRLGSAKRMEGKVGKKERGQRGLLGVPEGLGGFDFLLGGFEGEGGFYVCHGSFSCIFQS